MAHRQSTTTTTTTTSTVPSKRNLFGRRDRAAHHRHGKLSLGNRVIGAVKRLRGTVVRRPGEKATGTQHIHETHSRRSVGRSPRFLQRWRRKRAMGVARHSVGL
ncbi:hypothetical protein DL546_007584 [Coniochaeta pulveracea]|uniref:Uncharacterized protein n=1 Tax=Coniochaeta pulveracea TaxID=177199 RepID=A0A420YCT7_9PEZI|nr:hypothetical protein DL546_007584 [Coniochaeta pulveracea]